MARKELPDISWHTKNSTRYNFSGIGDSLVNNRLSNDGDQRAEWVAAQLKGRHLKLLVSNGDPNLGLVSGAQAGAAAALGDVARERGERRRCSRGRGHGDAKTASTGRGGAGDWAPAREEEGRPRWEQARLRCGSGRPSLSARSAGSGGASTATPGVGVPRQQLNRVFLSSRGDHQTSASPRARDAAVVERGARVGGRRPCRHRGGRRRGCGRWGAPCTASWWCCSSAPTMRNYAGGIVGSDWVTGRRTAFLCRGATGS